MKVGLPGSDIRSWPPDAGDSRIPTEFFAFRWGSEPLLAVSGQIFDLHRCLIFQKLSLTRGVSVPIDLFSWHWEAEAGKFCQKVLEMLPESGKAKKDLPEDKTLDPGETLASLEPEQKKLAHQFMRDHKISSDDAVVIAGFDPQKALNNLYEKQPWTKIGDYCPKPSLVCGDLVLSNGQNLKQYPTLWHCLQKWWGWSGYSLPEPPAWHMRMIIESNIKNLVQEGYLRMRRSNQDDSAEYELSDLGIEKLGQPLLENGGTFRDFIQRPDLISNSIQVITSVCQAVFSK